MTGTRLFIPDAVMSPQMNLRQVVLITWPWARVNATVEEIHEIT